MPPGRAIPVIALLLGGCASSLPAMVEAPRAAAEWTGRARIATFGGSFVLNGPHVLCTGAYQAWMRSRVTTVPITCTDARTGRLDIAAWRGDALAGTLRLDGGAAIPIVFGDAAPS
jgi:hypothetical protein